MNCAYHSINTAVVNCNGCGKPLCPACDHRIKGFPYCQNCIVEGVEMLRNRGNNSNYVPFVKKRTSPLIAVILSLICPGLGAAYNGQTSKALVYFAIFIGLFQLAVLSGGMAIFVLGFMGMWVFAALDSWRTAQMIRSGITPDGAEDIIVQRFAGNPKLWGIVLLVIGGLFFLQNVLNLRHFLRTVLPVLIIALGLYLLRDYFIKGKKNNDLQDIPNRADTPTFARSISETSFRTGEYEADYKKESGSKSWKTR
jgi:uncharacterized membrane protein